MRVGKKHKVHRSLQHMFLAVGFLRPSIFLLTESASKQTKTQHDPFLLLRVSRFQTHQRESAWAFGVLLILTGEMQNNSQLTVLCLTDALSFSVIFQNGVVSHTNLKPILGMCTTFLENI
jgi:phosphoribosyl-AMP cyclohydrolase